MGSGTFVLGASDLVETSTSFSNNTSNWERLTYNFTTGNTAGQDHLLIGGIQFVLFQDDLNNNATLKKAYYYIDNIVLREAFIPPTFDLPTTICSNGTPINLSQLVGNTTDTFSGPGVALIAGEYVFNPSIAGVGNHIINYTATSIDGCDVVALTDTIEVTNCTPPTPPYISQVYVGGGKDKAVEIKNASNTQSITVEQYYLVWYDSNGAPADLTTPTASIDLATGGAIAANDVKVFRTAAFSNPNYVTTLPNNEIFDINGYDGIYDIIIISTSNGANAYNDRVDVLGDNTASNLLFKEYTQ